MSITGYRPHLSFKQALCIIYIIILFFSVISQCFAITLLLKEEALKRVFPDADQITAQKISASKQQMQLIHKELGGKLVHILRGRQARQLNKQNEFVFYFGKKEGKTTGVAIILDEPGKWGLIRFIIRLSREGSIEAVAVMKYKEIRGRPIASQRFLKQFIGKTLADPIRLRRDIRAISGATISSRAACFTIRKAMLLYRQLVLNRNS
jgi:Na+-translocating ferredoxin:NAD+ oxidoreductase RnfG subunit